MRGRQALKIGRFLRADFSESNLDSTVFRPLLAKMQSTHPETRRKHQKRFPWGDGEIGQLWWKQRWKRSAGKEKGAAESPATPCFLWWALQDLNL